LRKPCVLCVVGNRRHVGKTTVLTKILMEMWRRGHSVGTVKHIGENSTFALTAGKDTSRHLEAGSQITLAVTSSEIIAFRRDLPLTLEAALSQMPSELDYILVEGFRQSKYPKIIVVESRSEDLRSISGSVIALVMDEKEIMKDGTKGTKKKFETTYLVDLIEEYFLTRD